ncbi:MAG: hypothetical protein ACOC28_06450, partial [Alkalispirochaetaceae bacterium]
MKHADRDRLLAAGLLAVLIHLVIGGVLYLTVPRRTAEQEEYRQPLRVVFNEPDLPTPPEQEPPEPEPPEPEPPEDPPEPEPEPDPEPQPPTPEPAAPPE